jgi:hypothetical protein
VLDLGEMAEEEEIKVSLGEYNKETGKSRARAT